MQDGVLGQEGDRFFVFAVSEVSVLDEFHSQLQFTLAGCDGLAEHASRLQHGGVSIAILHSVEVGVALSQGAGPTAVEGGRTTPQLPVESNPRFHADSTTLSSRTVA